MLPFSFLNLFPKALKPYIYLSMTLKLLAQGPRSCLNPLRDASSRPSMYTLQALRQVYLRILSVYLTCYCKTQDNFKNPKGQVVILKAHDTKWKELRL